MNPLDQYCKEHYIPSTRLYIHLECLADEEDLLKFLYCVSLDLHQTKAALEEFHFAGKQDLALLMSGVAVALMYRTKCHSEAEDAKQQAVAVFEKIYAKMKPLASGHHSHITSRMYIASVVVDSIESEYERVVERGSSE